MPEIVGYIKRNLLTDWSDINFIIGSNPEDYVEIRFDNDSIDAPKGLHAYMNTLINTNDFMPSGVSASSPAKMKHSIRESYPSFRTTTLK